MRIRQAIRGDAPAVLRLVEQLRDEDDSDLPPLTLAWVEHYLAAGTDRALLAEVDGEAAGLLTYRIHDDLFHGGPTALIEELVVDEGRRGAGIGTALLEAVFRIARDAGCVEIAVNTAFDNARAQALYRRAGLTRESLMMGTHFADGDLAGEDLAEGD